METPEIIQALAFIKRHDTWVLKSNKYSSLKDDEDFMLKALSIYGNTLEYASDRIKKNRSLVLIAVSNIGDSIQYADPIFRKDKEIIIKALSSGNKERTLLLIDDSLKNDKDVLAFFSDANNNEDIIGQVSEDGYELERLSDEYRNNKKVVLEAVKSRGCALEYASNELKNDKDVVFASVSECGEALEFASEELKNDFDIVMQAVTQTGLALLYASDELKRNKRIALKAVSWKNPFPSSEYVGPLSYVIDYFKNDIDVIKAAVIADVFAFEIIDKSFRSNKDFMLEVINNNPLSTRYIDDSLKNDKDILRVCSNSNDNNLPF